MNSDARDASNDRVTAGKSPPAPGRRGFEDKSPRSVSCAQYSGLLVVSNNPLVWAETDKPCRKVTGGALNVLYTCLGILGEEKHLLFAHPVAGNARLLHNPFRTVVLEQKENVTSAALQADMRHLEYFLKKLEALPGDVPAATRDDYLTIDHELFKAIFG